MPVPKPAIYGVLSAAALSLTAGLFGESPQEAAQRVRFKYATARATRVLNPVEAWRLQTGGVIDLSKIPGADPASVVGGSEDASGLLGGSATPTEALNQISALDEKWGAAVDAYRALHSIQTDMMPSGGGLIPTGPRVGDWGLRYPTRWAIFRLTMDALYHSDALNQKYGWPITDPASGKLNPEWLKVVATYAPSDQEWAEIHRQVEEHYTAEPESDWLDTLKSGLSLASAAVAGNWGSVARAVFSGGGGAGQTVGNRVLSIEEVAILNYLRGRYVQAEVRRFNVVGRDFSAVNTYRIRLTGAEALSGGGTPLLRGIAAFGGLSALAADLRALSALSLPTKSGPDETLVLKAVAICRRKPTPGNEGAAALQRVQWQEYNDVANQRGAM